MPDLVDINYGSVNIIEKPLLGGCKPYNDYGRGFYCTEYVELVKEYCAFVMLLVRGNEIRVNEMNKCM